MQNAGVSPDLPALACWLAFLPQVATNADALPPEPPRRIALDWAAPPARCPDEATLRAEVAAALERDPFEAGAARRLSIRWVSLPDGALAVDVTLNEAGTTRGAQRLVGRRDDCAALHHATALLVTLGLDPLRVSEPLPPTVVAIAAPSSEPPAAPTSSPPAPGFSARAETTPAAASDDDGPRAVWSAGGSLGLGTVPGLSVAGRLRAAARWPGRFEAGAALRATLPSGAPFAEGEVSGSLIGGDLDVCRPLDAFVPCLLVVGGWQPVWGDGFTRDVRGDAPYLAPGLSAGVHLPVLAGFEVRVALELLAPVTQVRLRVDDRTAWETPAMNGALRLEIAPR